MNCPFLSSYVGGVSVYGPQILIFFLCSWREGKGIDPVPPPASITDLDRLFYLQLCGPREVFFFFFFFVFFVFVDVDIIPFISTHRNQTHNLTQLKNQNHQFQCVLFSDNIGMRYGFGVVAHLGIFLILNHNTPTTPIEKDCFFLKKKTHGDTTNQPTDLEHFFIALRKKK